MALRNGKGINLGQLTDSVYSSNPIDPGGIVIAGGTKYRGSKGRVLRREGPYIDESGDGLFGEGTAIPLPTS